MDATAETTTVRLNAAGQIDEDLDCVRCSYNLRGLTPDRRCPECGTAAGRSMHGDLLRYCDPAWIDRLARGLRWLQAATIVPVVVVLAGSAAVSASGEWRNEPSEDTVGLVIGLAVITALLLGLMACWILTARDPGLLEQERTFNSRTAARYLPTLVVAGLPLVVVAEAIAPASATIGTVIWSLFLIAGVLGLLAYLRQLAMRIPDPKSARQLHRTMWVAILFTGILPIWLFFILLRLRNLVKLAADASRTGNASQAA